MVAIGTLGRIAVFADPLGATTGLEESHGVPNVNPIELGTGMGIIGSRLCSPQPITSENFSAAVFGTCARRVPARAPQCRQDVDLALSEPVAAVHREQLLAERVGNAVQAPDHRHGRDVQVGTLALPLAHSGVDALDTAERIMAGSAPTAVPSTRG